MVLNVKNSDKFTKCTQSVWDNMTKWVDDKQSCLQEQMIIDGKFTEQYQHWHLEYNMIVNSIQEQVDQIKFHKAIELSMGIDIEQRTIADPRPVYSNVHNLRTRIGQILKTI